LFIEHQQHCKVLGSGSFLRSFAEAVRGHLASVHRMVNDFAVFHFRVLHPNYRLPLIRLYLFSSTGISFGLHDHHQAIWAVLTRINALYNGFVDFGLSYLDMRYTFFFILRSIR
jgi:hypothetical protein